MRQWLKHLREWRDMQKTTKHPLKQQIELLGINGVTSYSKLNTGLYSCKS
ncbi:MAG: hypothetical protein H6617_00260 [Bdellovibrionaceae bacterium]|nr:hypothetical protein [Pseudobdellovibrionaceae bacterium]